MPAPGAAAQIRTGKTRPASSAKVLHRSRILNRAFSNAVRPNRAGPKPSIEIIGSYDGRGAAVGRGLGVGVSLGVGLGEGTANAYTLLSPAT